MISHFFKTQEDSILKTLEAPRTGVWTHVVAPTPEEFTELVSLYGVDETIIEDIKDVFEVPRFEQEGAASYFFTRYPYDVEHIDIDTAPMLIILGETYLITMSEHEVPFLQPFIEGKRAYGTTLKSTLFLEFMAELMVVYERQLTRMRKLVYRDMGRVRSIRGRDIQRLVFLEQELNENISALVPTYVWLQHLTKGNYIQMFSEDHELLEDLLIANSQLVDSAKSILKTIQNIRGASEAILTQNLNNTIRMLTATTVILTIPTLVSSLFGMNVVLPFQNHPYGFWLVLIIIGTAVALTVHFFLKNRWI